MPLEILLNVLQDIGIKHFLIGAKARDLHLLRRGIKPTRGTKDIDFAIMVDSFNQYDKILSKLKSKGFEETNEPFRLNWEKGETVFDLLPFGKIEENSTVNFNQRNIELSVIGFNEAGKELENYYISDNKIFSISVPPLHGIFMLKLLSWNTKKTEREKDLIDLIDILKNYWYFVDDEAFENHLDLFNDDFDTSHAAARILGRHLKKTLNKSEKLKSIIIQILNEQITDKKQFFIKKYVISNNQTLESAIAILKQILIGLKE